MFNKLNSSKYKEKDIFCISLQPIKNAIYIAEEEEEEFEERFFDDDDEYDP
jgi:hypothetical protein